MKKSSFLGIILLAAVCTPSCKKTYEPAEQQAETLLQTQARAAAGPITPLWGASSSPFPNEPITGIASWVRLNNRLKSKNGGTGLTFRRSYDNGIPANFSASAMAADVGNCPISVGSIKPSFSNSNSVNYNLIRDFVLSIPANRTVYLIFWHEPEDNIEDGQFTAAQYRSGLVNFIRAVISVQNQRPNVHPAFCLMAYTFKPQSGRNPEDYRPTGLTWDERTKTVAGIDGYFNDPTQSAASVFNPIFTKMGLNSGSGTSNWGFSRFGIFETAAHGSRASWVTNLGSWAKNHGKMELVSWYNSALGPNAGPQGWFLGTWGYNQSTGNFWWGDGDGSLNAYAQIIK
ncbi:MAG: hypothetical protein QM594_02830 [Niabella sp.]